MRPDDEPEADDERPWNEEQWEAFMKKSDVRAAKFGELLETFIDHPDRDEIIDHEMGWDRPEPGDERDDNQGDDADDEAEPFDPAAILEEAANSVDDEEWKEYARQEEEALHAIPAYRRGYAFALKLQRALKKKLGNQADEEDEDAGEAFINAHLIAVKIAGGHGMGYEDDVLCGNIVKCKHSLAAANECLAALERLRERRLLPPKKLEALIAECTEIRGLVEQRIAELRGKVWWQ